MLLDMDMEDADLGVEQEKLDPTVIVWDTCGRCLRADGAGAKQEILCDKNKTGKKNNPS